MGLCYVCVAWDGSVVCSLVLTTVWMFGVRA